jgi:ABC-type oligopeptide transport system substrate-binding subunit
LIHLLALSGDRAAALAEYERCREILWRELGVEPAEETTALYQRIRTGELAPAPSRPAEIGGQLPAWLVEEREPLPRPVFVGRERQLAQLEGFLESAIQGRGQVVFITGGPGQGKSALLEAFADRALETHPDLLTAAGHCNAFSGAGDPYLPFRHLLNMLTGDVQARLASGAIDSEGATRLWKAVPYAVQALVNHGCDLIDVMIPGRALAERIHATMPNSALTQEVQELVGRERSMPGDLAQSQLFEQLVQVLRSLAAEHPLLLTLDDLQWADSASINLLFHLGRELGSDRVLILGAYRPEEIALGRQGERHPLEKVLAELKRQYGDVWLDLARTEELEGQDFVDALLDSEPNRLREDFRGTLFRHTGGHPLFTVELLRAMQERGDLALDEDGRWVEGPSLDWDALPARVEGVIEERIGRLEEELREILTVASVEGEEFTAQVVARVGEIQERQLLRRLSRELERRHQLVQEQGEAQVGMQLLCRYRFSHALFQHYLYNDLSTSERRLLHRGMGLALEGLYGEEADAIAPQLARHFDEAGMPEKAIPYLLSVGDHARLGYAHQEAITAYRRAVALLKSQEDWEGAARTLMMLGLAHHNAFDFQAVRQAYDEAFALRQRAAVTVGASLPPAPHPLRISVQEPHTLDPARDQGQNVAMRKLFSGLVRSTADAGVEPEVARRWEVLDGGRRYIFHLRDDWRWSDNVPVTAGDLKYAWTRALTPETGAAYPQMLYDIAGARAFHQGEHTDPDQLGVRALDDLTLLAELEGPTSYFLQLLDKTISFPVPRHVVEVHGDRWTEIENLVTNGPFRLAEWQRGESIRFTRNPTYAGRVRVNLQEVQVDLHRKGWDARLAAYEAGDLDIIWLGGDWPIGKRVQVQQRHIRDYVARTALATAYACFNTTRPPFHDPRVRRALVLAADREKVINVLGGAYQVPATGGFVPPGIPGHAAGIGLPYDPDSARTLLAEAGYPGGRDFPPVVGQVLSILVDGYLVEQFLDCWRENLGVEIDIQTVPYAGLLESLSRDSPHLYFGGWGAAYPDPDYFLRVGVDSFRTALPWPHTAYDKLVERARRLMDQEERIKLYRQAEAILMQEAYLMPTMYRRYHQLIKPWVKFPPSAPGWWYWSHQDFIIEPH